MRSEAESRVCGKGQGLWILHQGDIKTRRVLSRGRGSNSQFTGSHDLGAPGLRDISL